MPDDSLGVRSVSRITNLLKCFTLSQPVFTLTALSKRLRLPLTTTHRLIGALESEGFLVRSADGQGYQLGYVVMHLGTIAQASLEFRNEARPILHALAEDTGETAVLFVRDEDMAMSTEGVESSQPLRVAFRVGDRIPIYTSGAARILIAFLPLAEIEELVSKWKLVPLTPFTITSREELLAELTSIRQNGFAISYEQSERGSMAIGAPVFNFGGRVIASVGIIAPSVRIPPENAHPLVEKVKAAGRELSQRLGSP